MSAAASEIHGIAKLGDAERMRALLAGQPAAVKETSNDGKTALHYAALGGKLEVAEVLIAAGADVNAKDRDSWTPLHCAALKGQTRIAALLRLKGADVRHRQHRRGPLLGRAATTQNWSACSLIAAQCQRASQGWPDALAHGCGRHVTNIATLLLDRGGVRPRQRGFRPLHMVVMNNQKGMINCCWRGSDINAKDNRGRRPGAGQVEAAGGCRLLPGLPGGAGMTRLLGFSRSCGRLTGTRGKEHI